MRRGLVLLGVCRQRISGGSGLLLLHDEQNGSERHDSDGGHDNGHSSVAAGVDGGVFNNDVGAIISYRRRPVCHIF